MKRHAMACAVAFLAALACRRTPDVHPAALAVPAERTPFVGSISQVRDGVMLWVDEESATGSRRGNVFLTPTTEIVMRNGMLVPSANLRRGMRATVWFRGAVGVTTSSVSGTASRIVVDY